MDQPPNLTRAQARTRADLLTVHSYDIAIDLTDGQGGPGEKTYLTRSTVIFDATPGSSTFIDFVGDGIATAVLNGQEISVAAWSISGGLPLDDLAATNELVIDAVGVYTNTGEGLHRFVDPVDGAVYLYSQFETADAKRLYACFDQPNLKATFDLTVTAPASFKVIGNAPAVAQSAGYSGSRVHQFATTTKLSTYVTALVAGPYHEVKDHHDGIDLGIYCRQSLATHLDADRIFAETKLGFDFFHGAFEVRYPFGKYDQLFVPEFNAGAMENAGAVTLREEYVFRSKVTDAMYERRCTTILHEMAHMWFGDLVTMDWWDDLWLNESFAEWAAVVAQDAATEYTNAWTTFVNVEKSWAYVQDQLPSTHPIAADMVDLAAVEVNFDGITYAKGASVLKQLAAYVGYDEFLAGLRAYFVAHAFGNATLADLLGALEDTSGRDLSGWSRNWLQTTGLNTLEAHFEVDGHGVFTSFDLLQSGAQPGAGEYRTHRLAIGIYDDVDGVIQRVHRVEIDVDGAVTSVPKLIGRSRGLLILLNDDDLTYCKVRLDPTSLATAVARVGDIAESLPRTLIWSALWEMTRDAQLRARDFLELALRGLPTETDNGVVQRILGQAQLAVGSYAEHGWAAETGWPALAGGLLNFAVAAQAGSDRQLTVVGALAGAKLGDQELAAVAGWLDGSAPLTGLAVDADLSWTLLGALVAHGRAGDTEIDAAAKADATASGQRRAVQVRALRPGVEEKTAIWDRLIGDDGMANALQDAAIRGFSHPAAGNSLDRFTALYFQSVDQVWARRSNETAQKVAIGLYPRWATSPATLDLAREWEAQDHPSALRRLVSEGRSSTERALRAKACDAGTS